MAVAYVGRLPVERDTWDLPVGGIAGCNWTAMEEVGWVLHQWYAIDDDTLIGLDECGRWCCEVNWRADCDLSELLRW